MNKIISIEIVNSGGEVVEFDWSLHQKAGRVKGEKLTPSVVV